MWVPFEYVWPVAGKTLGERDPGVAHAVDFERGKVEVLGAQIADGNPIVRADVLHRRVEFGKVGGMRIGEASDEQANQTCNAGNPGNHGIHRILTRARIEL